MGEYISTLVETKDRKSNMFSFELNKTKWSMGHSALMYESSDRIDNVYKTTVGKAKNMLKERLSFLTPKTNIYNSLSPIINDYLKKLSFFNDDCVIESNCACLYDESIEYRDIIAAVSNYENMFEKIKEGYYGKTHYPIDDYKEKMQKVENYLLEKIVIVNDVMIDYPVTSSELKTIYNIDNMYEGFYVIYPVYFKYTCPTENVFAYLSQFNYKFISQNSHLFPTVREFRGWKVSENEKVFATYLVIGNLKSEVEEVVENSIPYFFTF